MVENVNSEIPHKEEEKEKLGSLENVEKIVAQYASGMARDDYGINPNIFRISLVRQGRGDMHIMRGAIIRIVLEWPTVQPYLNSMLNEAFRQIKKNNLQDTFAIESYAMVRARRDSVRKWYKESFGDEAEIIPDLLSQGRIIYHTSKTVTVKAKDERTGIVVEVYDKTGKRSTDDMRHEARYALSRLVRDAEEVLVDNKKEAVTSSHRYLPCKLEDTPQYQVMVIMMMIEDRDFMGMVE